MFTRGVLRNDPVTVYTVYVIDWVRSDDHAAAHQQMPAWRRSAWAQWLISNSLFRSPLERLADLRHLRANYEKHTQAIYFVPGPMGLFEEAKALKAEEQKGRGVGYESSIMMTMFHKGLVSHPLTGLQRRSIYLYLPGSWAYPCLSKIINICKCINYSTGRIQYEREGFDVVCKWTEIMCSLYFPTPDLLNMCITEGWAYTACICVFVNVFNLSCRRIYYYYYY